MTGRAIRIFSLQFFIGCGLLLCQNITSSVLGSITDSSGAPVPGAQINVTNSGTGVSTTAVTDSKGTYLVPALLAGIYDITVQKPGFETYRATGLHLFSAEAKRVDAVLKVGAVQQTVTVTDVGSMLNTDSMTIGDSVSTRQLSDLPTSLQTVDAFIALAPGVQSNGDATNPPIGGGTHWGSVNFTLNGVGVNDPGNSGAVTVQGVGLLVLPPPSSIQELNVQSNDMSAKYRAHSDVTMVTKAGTNEFHLMGYEYLQNTILNANEFLLNAVGTPRQPTRLNQFGGNVSGPIWRRKAFFFADFNGYRHQASDSVRLNLPSQAMRQGDFSALCSLFNGNGVCAPGKGTQLYNPFTGKPFPKNQIPSSLITPQAQALLKYLPLPTDVQSPGLPSEKPNYIATVPVTQNVDAEDIRIDYDLSSSDRIFGVYAQRVAEPWNAFNNYPPDYGQGRYGYKNYTVSGTETHTFSASTINELRLGWGDYATKFSGQNQDFWSGSLFPQMPPTFYRGLPTTTISGYTGMFHDYGTGYYTPRWDVEITDNFTHVHGRHTIEAGLDETGYKIFSRVPSTGNATGAFTFSGHWTGNLGWPGAPTSGGNAFADFLLGVADSSTTNATGAFASMVYSRDWGAYVQDTWQASPRLTLIYGLRYEYQSPWTYRTPQVTTLDLARNKLVLPENSPTPTLPPGASAAEFAAYPFETTQSIGLPLQYIQPDKNNFAPRVGFAFRPFQNGRTVIRAGYGVYYNMQPAFVGSRADAWNPPWQLSISQSFVSKLPGKPKTPYLPDITFVNPFPSTNGTNAVSPNPTIYMLQWDFRNAVMQEWNLTAEHEFGTNLSVRGSYIGSQAHHLPWEFGDINVPLTQTPNVPIQNQRPFQPWGTISATRSGGKQNFDQLQLELKKRLTSGLSFQAEYQFTRSLDNVPTAGGPQNWNYPDLDYGNSTGIRRHWLVFNYIYELPFGRGRKWLSNSNGLVNALAGGWEISGISTYGSGPPFSVMYSQTGTKFIGWWGGRADVLAGAPLYAGRQSGSHDIVDGVQWFNPDAFVAPQPWTWGNSARDMLFGPGLWNWDVSAMKTFNLTERLRLQFRGDFLDAFNHFNLGQPTATIADLRDGGSPVANSGQILGGSGSRIIQLSANIQF